MMFGWRSTVAASASRRKRIAMSVSAITSRRSSLTATARSSLRVERAMDRGHATEADDLAEPVAAADEPADVRGGVRGLGRLGHRATIAEVPKMSARCAADGS